ncbi:AraC family transcriptional regulator [Clostridium botulinum]|uniref:AraC family transcriptional regulator n=1 Tax=Clostridium botulinum TaxID=1491 RepID=UPI000A170665|nr:GyrI-like domain-containing protein [Clostridium botulinum]AUN16819.1 AraC family transcriptional regulator [Clostridium botulinum]MBY6798577.1 AraC family transcriptional regulator [Clostridium botulinum]MCC5424230.1 AraC family transcriptional regulator [Clostridium botulinum]NFC26911.1 AraC family transcriptional regulator [Clostridium botulinum]NFC60857.1 AraC family transcriptional regulator [Clostridium botulinum]
MIIKKSLINKSIEYILQHIDEDISIEDVANHCNFSKYHFSRMFKEETGVSIYAFIKRMRMDQSSVSLKVEKDKTITDIGVNYGYSSSNYSSAFSKQYSICPLEFRKAIDSTCVSNPFCPSEYNTLKSFEHYNKKIIIENLADFKVIYERYIGNYIDIGDNWYSFMERYKTYIKPDTLLIEKSYDDPSITELEKCIYDLCITVGEDVELENVTTIKGGKFAVYRFNGYIHDIFVTFQGVFNIWLPRSGYKMDERYGLGIYHNIDRKNNHVTMDLCIAIK